MLAPGGEVDSPTRLARLTAESLKLYPDFVGELESESGCAIDFARCGAIELTGDDRRMNAQSALGIRSERLNANEVFYPDDAVVDPRDVVRALRVACERRGVEIHENSPVKKIDGPAVLAAGAWSSMIETPVPIRPAFPVRGHLVSYRMPPGSVPKILRSGNTYILQRKSGLTIVGSSSERIGFDRTVNSAMVADISTPAAALSFPNCPSRTNPG